MAYYTQNELEQIGFKYLGKNVKISNKVSIYDADQMMIGENSRIDDFCVVSGKVEVGRNVFIGVHGNLAGGINGIHLADFVTLAYYVNIFTQSDDYLGDSMTNSTIPRKYKKETFGSVTVGKHVIVGANSVIMPNAHLAEGCSIGAMSLVTKSTEEWGVYVGIPAKRIRERKRDILMLEKQYLKEVYND